MSTAALFALCALLVFSPFVLEGVRLVRRVRRLLSRRRDVPAPPDYGSTFEASVRDALYGREPRWQRIDVAAPRPRASRSAPPYVVRRPEPAAPLRPVAAGDAADEQDSAAPADGAVRAA